MPSDRTDLALLDIRDNILLAQEFIEGVSFEGFQSDRRTFYAVTRCLEIISEAARRLSRRCVNGTPNCHGARLWALGMSTVTITTMWRKSSSGGRYSKALSPYWRLLNPN